MQIPGYNPYPFSKTSETFHTKTVTLMLGEWIYLFYAKFMLQKPSIEDLHIGKLNFYRVSAYKV